MKDVIIIDQASLSFKDTTFYLMRDVVDSNDYYDRLRNYLAMNVYEGEPKDNRYLRENYCVLVKADAGSNLDIAIEPEFQYDKDTGESTTIWWGIEDFLVIQD